MKYYIIAGEASGDLHGAGLIRGLLQSDPDCGIRFWGGDCMAAEGGTMVRHFRDTAVMGFTEVVGKAGKILSNIKFCRQDICSYHPDAVILIDYPGFNLKIARFASRLGIKVFYYIPPKVWARGRNRIRLLKRFVDRVFIIFPFEEKFFRDNGIDAKYVGNPLIDRIDSAPLHQISEGGKFIALFPGSRIAELKFLMPRFMELEKLLKSDSRYDGYRIVIAGAPSMDEQAYRKYMPSTSDSRIVFGDTYSILKQASAAIVCSGTASLEAALCGTPQVVCYGFSRITYAIARMLVRVKYISLANLILDKLIFKEMIQDSASPLNMKKELDSLAFDESVRSTMAENYRQLRVELGGNGASDRVASAIVNHVKKN